MRILYIGELWEGGTCLERMHTLRTMGHEVASFDTSPWACGGKRAFRSLAHRLNYGPHVWKLNKALISHSSSTGRVDLVWIDKGRWIYPTTLDAIREQTRGRLLHYTPDPQLLFHKSRHFRLCIPIYDWVVTTKPFERELYTALGANNVLFALQSFDTRFVEYQPLQHDAAFWSSDLCFVGHFEKHYAGRLQSASDIVSQLSIWGPGWERYAKRNNWARTYVKGGGIWGDDYLRALAHAKIALGLLSKWIPETTTTRSFEIPAMGILLLAERTEDHLALFEESKEAEFFGDDEELKDKLRFYLAHDEARNRIAAAGRERCLRSGYSSPAQLKSIIQSLS